MLTTAFSSIANLGLGGIAIALVLGIVIAIIIVLRGNK